MCLFFVVFIKEIQGFDEGNVWKISGQNQIFALGDAGNLRNFWKVQEELGKWGKLKEFWGILRTWQNLLKS